MEEGRVLSVNNRKSEQCRLTREGWNCHFILLFQMTIEKTSCSLISDCNNRSQDYRLATLCSINIITYFKSSGWLAVHVYPIRS
jgi:hypothetical protein